MPIVWDDEPRSPASVADRPRGLVWDDELPSPASTPASSLASQLGERAGNAAALGFGNVENYLGTPKVATAVPRAFASATEATGTYMEGPAGYLYGAQPLGWVDWTIGKVLGMEAGPLRNIQKGLGESMEDFGSAAVQTENLRGSLDLKPYSAKWFIEGGYDALAQVSIQYAIVLLTGGSSLVSGMPMGVQTAGRVYGEQRARLEQAGEWNKETERKVAAASLTAGAVEGLLEAASLEGLRGKIPAVDNIARKMLGDKLKNKTAKTLASLATGALTEGGTEALQEVTTSLSQLLIAGDPNAMKDIGSRATQSGVLGALAGGGAKIALDTNTETETGVTPQQQTIETDQARTAGREWAATADPEKLKAITENEKVGGREFYEATGIPTAGHKAWKFNAVDKSGQELEDVIYGMTEKEVVAQIRDMGYFVTSIEGHAIPKEQQALNREKRKAFIEGAKEAAAGPVESAAEEAAPQPADMGMTRDEAKGRWVSSQEAPQTPVQPAPVETAQQPPVEQQPAEGIQVYHATRSKEITGPFRMTPGRMEAEPIGAYFARDPDEAEAATGHYGSPRQRLTKWVLRPSKMYDATTPEGSDRLREVYYEAAAEAARRHGIEFDEIEDVLPQLDALPESESLPRVMTDWLLQHGYDAVDYGPGQTVALTPDIIHEAVQPAPVETAQKPPVEPQATETPATEPTPPIEPAAQPEAQQPQPEQPPQGPEAAPTENMPPHGPWSGNTVGEPLPGWDSLRNATMDDLARNLGLEPAKKEGRVTNAEIIAHGMDAHYANREAGRNMVARVLEDRNYNPSDFDRGVLLVEVARLDAAVSAASGEANSKRDANQHAEAIAALNRKAELLDEFKYAEMAAKRAATLAGRSLNFQRLHVNMSFTEAAVLNDMKTFMHGKDAPGPWQVEARKAHEQWKEGDEKKAARIKELYEKWEKEELQPVREQLLEKEFQLAQVQAKAAEAEIDTDWRSEGHGPWRLSKFLKGYKSISKDAWKAAKALIDGRHDEAVKQWAQTKAALDEVISNFVGGEKGGVAEFRRVVRELDKKGYDHTKLLEAEKLVGAKKNYNYFMRAASYAEENHGELLQGYKGGSNEDKLWSAIIESNGRPPSKNSVEFLESIEEELAPRKPDAAAEEWAKQQQDLPNEFPDPEEPAKPKRRYTQEAADEAKRRLLDRLRRGILSQRSPHVRLTGKTVKSEGMDSINSLHAALEASNPTGNLKALWDELLPILESQTKGLPRFRFVETVATASGVKASGIYEPLSHSIDVSSSVDTGYLAQVLIHEAVHAATRNAALLFTEPFYHGERAKDVPQRTREAYSRLEKIGYEIDRARERQGKSYEDIGVFSTINHPVELIAEAFTNETFQKWMAEQKVPGSTKYAELRGKTLLQSFIDTIKRFLGITGKRAVSALEEVLGLSHTIMQEDVGGTATQVAPMSAVGERRRVAASQSLDIVSQGAPGISQESLGELTTIGGFQFEEGGRTRGRWNAKMVAYLGDWVKPHLSAIWSRVQASVAGSERERITAQINKRMDAGEPLSSMGRAVKGLFRNFVAQGLDREAAVAAVHEELKNVVDPFITEEEVIQAITGYGDVKELSKDEIEQNIQQALGELRELEKIRTMVGPESPLWTGDVNEAMAAGGDLYGEAPKASGKQMPTPEAVWRRLKKIVERLKRRQNYDAKNPDRALKSTLESMETRMLNHMEDMLQAIKNNERIARTPANSTDLEGKLDKLKAIYAEAKAVYRDIFPSVRKPMSDAQRAKQADRRLEQAIEKAQADIDAYKMGLEPVKKGKAPAPVNLELESKQISLDALQEELKLLRMANRTVKSPQQKATEASIRATEKEIDKINEQIANGPTLEKRKSMIDQTNPQLMALKEKRDQLRGQLAEQYAVEFEIQRRVTQAKHAIARANEIIANDGEVKDKRKPRPDVDRDPEVMKWAAVQLEAERRANALRVKARIKGMSLPMRTGYEALRVLGLAKAIKSSYDMSGFRQAMPAVLARPSLIFPGLKAGFTALKSDAAMNDYMAKMRSDPDYVRMKRAGFSFTEQGGKLSDMEEAYASGYEQKVWGVSHSARAFSTMLNAIRFEYGKIMINSFGENGQLTGEQLKHVGKMVNVFTGRGDLGNADHVIAGAGAFLWAPRLLVSRFQILLGEPMWRADPAVRKAIAKEYLRMGRGALAVTAMAWLAMAALGDEDDAFEWDSRSPWFMKPKFGNTYVDPWGGLAQSVVFAMRWWTGETKTAGIKNGKIYRNRMKVVPVVGDDVPYGQPDLWEITTRFFRTKLHPAIGTVFDWKLKKNVVGEKVSTASAAFDLVAPMGPSDFYDAVREEGLGRGTALGFLSLFGFGLQTIREDSTFEDLYYLGGKGLEYSGVVDELPSGFQKIKGKRR